ncbi:BQ2448_7128 [Microbotryum intermedium]|uniref:BQ2448_7128 protein n=1 Tax=Microbotryum intermedium TaxID=269621 RepID=A0A238FMF8_9BASI|nr:BQ2448_7128 [Microbotryum intermedium]
MPAMSNPTAPSPAYKPNDPPQLHSTSMEALREYFMRLDFYNRHIARVPITSDYDKIEGAGMGLQVIVLKTWFTQGLSRHLAKPYRQFKSELIHRAVPANFVWTQLEALHRLRQAPGHAINTFQDFSDQMCVLQMEIGFQVVSDQEITKLVLLGTNPELCQILRMHVVSALAGWSDLSLERLALNVPTPSMTNHENAEVSSDAPTEQPLEFDYQVFKRIGHEEWSVIAQHRQAIALQVNALQQRPTHAGCYHCHAINADHISHNCPQYSSPMGAPTNPSNPTLTAPAPCPGPRMVVAIQTFQETGNSTAFVGLSSDSEDDNNPSYAPHPFPPLPVSLLGAHGTLLASTLVNSGSPQSFLSEKLVQRLGLKKRALEQHSKYTLAKQNQVPIRLKTLPSAQSEKVKGGYLKSDRGYPLPKKYCESWYLLLQEHLASGRLRPSCSSYSSPLFIIPKKGSDVDPTIKPRWVNNYRKLNGHTVKDRTPLPLPDDILSTCSKVQFWAKINMTNSFFQTKMAEDDIPKTAVSTPWGLYKWTVMPMGLCNARATHQQRVNEALQGLLGTICFVYLDDITIFADTLEEHEARVHQVLEVLRHTKLYCLPTKTNLATAECLFLGHVINCASVHADPRKVQHIHDWGLPNTVKELRGFLGLVQYLCKFIPSLAEHTAALTSLTRQGLTSITKLWTPNKIGHFEAIKSIVTSLDCLQSPDHSTDAAPFWVMTDASAQGIRGVFLQGHDWKTACPIAYWSRQYIPAERNYPTHEQELLAIIEALKEWHIDLLGGHFHILTNHSTLEHFQTQRTILSHHQACWLNTLAEFDYDLWYLPSEDNIVANAMSRYSFPEPLPALVASISHIKLSNVVKQQILDTYETNPFCKQAMANIGSVTLEFKIIDALLYLRGRLIIPSLALLLESILHNAHDAQGHLGDMKTYRTVQQAYFWPYMSRDIKHYVQQCDSCQRTKAQTTRIASKLHALPVSSRPMADIAIDFVGPLPTNKGFDRILTITNRLLGGCCHKADTAADVATRFHEGWHRLFSLHQSVVSNRDKLFMSKFWAALHKRLNIKLQLSSAFHPEMDGHSKKTNNTAFQILQALVNKEQSNWMECLAVCEYAINSSLNVATGKTPFELVLGYTPSVMNGIPPISMLCPPSLLVLLSHSQPSPHQALPPQAVTGSTASAQLASLVP